jgi:hypothetical protein
MISYSHVQHMTRCPHTREYLDQVMHLRLALSAALGVLFLAAAPVAAYASVGVGVQADPVQLAGVAHPGGTYSLPPVYVVNTGTEPESVTIRIERISRGTGHTVPRGWISISALPSSLGHGQSARIPLSLVVPASARPGQYFSDVVVMGSAALTAGSARLGVAAATDLEFRVVPGVVSTAWFTVPTWVLLAVAFSVALALAVVLMTRSGISIRVERAAAGAAAGNGGGRGA